MATTYQDIFKKGYTTTAPKTGNYATLKTGGVSYYKPITSPTGYSNVVINPNQKGATMGGVVGQVNTDSMENARLSSLQPTQTPTQTPTTETFTPNYDFSNYSTSLTNYLNAIKPQTPEEKIKQQQQYYELLKQQYDPQIAATTAVYGDILARQQEQSKGAIGQTRAMTSAAGLAGTPMGQAQMAKTQERQLDIEKAIDREKGAKIQQILGEVRTLSQKEAERDTLDRMKYADKALEVQKEIITQAKQNLFDLAKSGYGWDAKTKQLAEQAGYTGDLAEVLYKASMPTEGAIDWKTVNVGDGKVLFYGVNPQTGQLEQKTTDVNVPQGYKTTFANGQMYYVPEKNAEGDLSGAIKYESEADKKFRQEKELAVFKANLTPQGTATGGGTVKPTPSLVNDLADIKNINDTLAEITTIGDSIGWKGVGSIFQGTGADVLASIGLGGENKQQEISLRTKLANVKAYIAKLRGGTSFTAAEEKLLNSYTPTKNDDDTVLQTKIKNLSDFLNNKVNTLSSYYAIPEGLISQEQTSGQYQVGQVYEDANGNKAKWTGNGWQKI